MVPSSSRSYSAVVLFRSRSNLKSSRAISYHLPRYFALLKGVTATAPLGMVAHDEKRIPDSVNNMMEIVFPVFIMMVFTIFWYAVAALIRQILHLLPKIDRKSVV